MRDLEQIDSSSAHTIIPPLLSAIVTVLHNDGRPSSRLLFQWRRRCCFLLGPDPSSHRPAPTVCCPVDFGPPLTFFALLHPPPLCPPSFLLSFFPPKKIEDHMCSGSCLFLSRFLFFFFHGLTQDPRPAASWQANSSSQ